MPRTNCADGGFGERQKGTGKEQGGEARITEDVPGDLNKESFAPCFGRAFLFLRASQEPFWSLIIEY